LRHDVHVATRHQYQAVIQSDYSADPVNERRFPYFVTFLSLLGDIVPDGHVPNHRGAWPADVYSVKWRRFGPITV